MAEGEMHRVNRARVLGFAGLLLVTLFGTPSRHST
jgi:hypothetical protein